MKYSALFHRGCIAAIFTSAFLSVSPCFAALPNNYEADSLLENSHPRWAEKSSSGVRVVLDAHALQITADPQHKFYYSIGTNVNGYEFGDGSSGWHANPEQGGTVDISLSLAESSQDREAIRLHISDGTHLWTIGFWPDKILLPGHAEIPCDVREKDTYRFVFIGDQMNVYSARNGLLTKSAFKATDTKGDNILGFGAVANSDLPMQCTIYSIRWTNSETLDEPPSSE